MIVSVVAGLAVAGIAACGTGPGPAGAPAPVGVSVGSASASPAVTGTVPAVPGGRATPSGRVFLGGRTLTMADDGAKVRLRVGQSVAVVLVGRGLMWDVPGASGRAVRRVSAVGGYPAAEPARAVFRAVRRGVSWLMSSTDARCLHAQPRCEIPQRLWRAEVIVWNR